MVPRQADLLDSLNCAHIVKELYEEVLDEEDMSELEMAHWEQKASDVAFYAGQPNCDAALLLGLTEDNYTSKAVGKSAQPLVCTSSLMQ